MRKGIPDEANKSLTGDEKDAARAYAKHNKNMREGHGARGGLLQDLKPPASISDAARALIDMPEDTLAQIAAKHAAPTGAANIVRTIIESC